MLDKARGLIVYAVVATIVATVWTLGWAQYLDSRTSTGYYPCAQPELFKRIMREQEKESNPVASVDPTK